MAGTQWGLPLLSQIWSKFQTNNSWLRWEDIDGSEEKIQTIEKEIWYLKIYKKITWLLLNIN